MSALNPRQLVDVIRGAGFPEDVVPTMTAIALAESGGNPRAHNPNAATGDNSYGLFQVNMLGGMGPERRREFGIASDKELFDPVINAKAAKRIYDSQGLNAWSVHKNGAYQRHLQAARGAAAGGGGGSFPSSSPPAALGSPQTESPATQDGAGGLLQGFLDRIKSGFLPGQVVTGGAPAASSPAPSPAAPGGGRVTPEDFFRTLAFGFTPRPSTIGGLSNPSATPRGQTRMAGGADFQNAVAGGFDPLSFGQEAMASVMADIFSPKPRTPKGQDPSQAGVPAATPEVTPGMLSPGSGAFSRLTGVRTGNTGGSTGPHLDVRWADRSPIKPSDVAQYLRVGGKSLDAFPVTSPYGRRVHPIRGGTHLHAGFDLGTPANLPIEVAPGVEVIRKHWDPGGGGWVKTLGIPTANGMRELQLLHLNSTD